MRVIRTMFVALMAAVMTLILGPVVIIARVLGMPQGPNSIFAWCIRTCARSGRR